MDQMTEQKRRNVRIALCLGALVAGWYVIAMFVVLQS